MKRMNWLLLGSLALALALPAFAQVTQNPPGQAGPQGQSGRRNQRGGKIFKQMDKNNDRQISRDEWNRKPKAFDRLDRNADGVLSTDELQAAANQRRPR